MKEYYIASEIVQTESVAMYLCISEITIYIELVYAFTILQHYQYYHCAVLDNMNCL